MKFANINGNTLFTPFKLDPITLRNRTIRAAAFEGMCPGNKVSEELINHVCDARSHAN